MRASLRIIGAGDEIEELKKIFPDHVVIIESVNERGDFVALIDLRERSVEDSRVLLVDLVDRGFFVDESKLRNLHLPLDELKFSIRAMKAIDRSGCESVGDLTDFSYVRIMKGRFIGRKVANEIRAKLNEMGFDFGMKIKGFHREPLSLNHLAIGHNTETAMMDFSRGIPDLMEIEPLNRSEIDEG